MFQEAQMTIDIGYKPHSFQLKIHREAKRFTVVVAHRRFGKTYCSVMTLIHAALATKKLDARFGYIAPFLKQAKQIAWDYLRRFSSKIPNVKINESELSIEYPNGSRVRLFGADNADAMRGLYFDGIISDEMADFKPNVLGDIIRPALADRKGWAMFIGTPKGLNKFSELYNMAASGEDPEWTAMMFRVDETDLIDKNELDSSKSLMSDAQYRQEWLCDFSAACDNVLITIDMVSEASRRIMREADLQGAPRIIGVDVARFGEDRSVIQRRWGLAALAPIVLKDIDNMDLAARVAGVINEWNPDAVFIDAGRGEGVIDRLRQLGYSVVEVNFGGKPNNNHYADKRSEMWDLMKQWIEAGGIIPNELSLKTDLCVPTYSFDAMNRMRLESKDKIKERGLKSPDLADALALTWAHPVKPKITDRRFPQRSVIQQDDPYNPFSGPEWGDRNAKEYNPFYAM
jgi:hypothetical protein